MTSHFKQEKKVVKLVWGPVTQDSDSEEVTFTAYAYCKQHVTQENEPCKVSWKVEWKEGMMQVARIADQVDGLAGQSAHAPLPRMVKGVRKCVEKFNGSQGGYVWKEELGKGHSIFKENRAGTRSEVATGVFWPLKDFEAHVERRAKKGRFHFTKVLEE